MRQWFARPSTAQRSGYEGLIPGVKSPARARPVAVPRRRDASLPGTRRNLRRSQPRSSQPTSGHGLVTASRAFSASRCSSWRVRDGQRARKQDECGSGSFAIRACRGKAETHELARLRTGFDKHHVLFDGTAREGNALPVRRRSEEHTSELQSRLHLVCRLLLEKKKIHNKATPISSHHDPA